MTSSSVPMKPSRRRVGRLRAVVRRQDGLGDAEVADEAHLGEALASGAARGLDSCPP